MLLIGAIDRLILGLNVFRKKFKSFLKFQHNFRQMMKIVLKFSGRRF
jgi:hypothetical protein